MIEWISCSNSLLPGSADLRALSAFLLGSKAREARLQQGYDQALLGSEELIALQRWRAEWQREFDKEVEIVAQEAWQSAARRKVS
jgi:hypothetical protein